MLEKSNSYGVGNYYYIVNKLNEKESSFVRILEDKIDDFKIVNLRTKEIREVDKIGFTVKGSLYLSKQLASLIGFKESSNIIRNKDNRYYCYSYENDKDYIIQLIKSLDPHELICKQVLISKKAFIDVKKIEDLYDLGFQFSRVEELFDKLNSWGYNINCDEVVRSFEI